jgi:CRISPR-associated protein Csm3
VYRGTVTVTGQIRALTGLRVGKPAALDIGGIDEALLRDPVTGKPYVPGSSLKGKLRFLCERLLGVPLRQLVPPSASLPQGINIHFCASQEEYMRDGRPCPVCRVFGTRGPAFEPTRLIVRDAVLSDALDPGDGRRLSWDDVDTEAPYAEVKVENVLDRLNCHSTPRFVERVPAGSLFDMELVYHVHDGYDLDNFRILLQGLVALTFDYLGGSGSRGYGRVSVDNVGFQVLTREVLITGGKPQALAGGRRFRDIHEAAACWDAIRSELQWRLGV